MTDKYRKQQFNIMASGKWWFQRDMKQMSCTPQTMSWESGELGAPLGGGDGADSLEEVKPESTRQSSREEAQRENCSIFEGLSCLKLSAGQCVDKLVGTELLPDQRKPCLVPTQGWWQPLSPPVIVERLSLEGPWGRPQKGCAQSGLQFTECCLGPN